jgi:gliding motility-associated-like protein
VYQVTTQDTVTGCINTDEVLILNNAIPPVANAGADRWLGCNGDPVVLDASGSAGAHDLIYRWFGPETTEYSGIVVEVLLPGVYYLVVQDIQNGCESTDSAEVRMTSGLPEASIEMVPPLCAGDESGEIRVQPVVGDHCPCTYSLDGILFQSSPVFTGLTAGSYNIVVRDSLHCEWDTQVVLDDGQVLDLDIGPDLELRFTDSVTLYAVLNGGIMPDSIIWEPAEALSCSNCLNPGLTAIYNRNFAVTATAYWGDCVVSDMLLVRVSDIEVFVPNIFTPNHDGINDNLTVFGSPVVERIISFAVFDRFGECVYEVKNIPLNQPDLGWDGTYKGRQMNPGVFVYHLLFELRDGSVREQRGDITLLR